MKQLNFWIVALCIWLALLYNLERWNEPINIASFFYVYTIIVVVVVLLVPWFQRASLHWVFLIAVPIYFLLRHYLGYPFGGSYLPITITEISALGITILLSRQAGRCISGFQEAVAEQAIDRLYSGTYTFETGQGQIYREMRRARLYKRPATLMAIRPTDESLELSLNRYVREVLNVIVDKYVFARVARLLVEELPDCDVIAKRDDHFIVLLPEVVREEADKIVKHLQLEVNSKLGLTFAIGLSTFPDEAVTFETLLEQAEVAMDRPLSGEDEQMPLVTVAGHASLGD